MENNLSRTVKRVNELFIRTETGGSLTEREAKEQRTLRDELINYFKFAITKHSTNKNKMFNS